MKQLKIDEDKIIRKFSIKGGIVRQTRCPYCGNTITIDNRGNANCGHVVKIYQADGKWYGVFSKWKVV